MDPEITTIATDAEVKAVLQRLCELTDMGFAAVARVTEKQWIACQVLDKIEFGLEPGSELAIKTTICDEIRGSGQPVFIDCVSNSPSWWEHPVPRLYGFQSYVSVPLYRADGSFFGTMCAVDPNPRTIDTPITREAIQLLANQVMESLDRLALS